MSDRPDRKPLLFAAAALYSAGLVFFYIKYVPIVASFQAVLAPVLAAVAIAAALNLERGILAFLFCFPLINGLPYVFGIGGSTPHAPTALVLFLFFFLGYLIRAGFGLPKPPPRPGVAAPILLLSGLVAASALITFWRYANFAPLRSDRIYELVANVNGVTAGGAVMSVVFSALSYLAGFAFFLILLRFVGREAFVAKALTTVLAGAALAVGFGLVQRFGDIRLGNTEAGCQAGALNATLKDPNSFGAYLCVVIPLALGAALGLRGFRRLGSAALLLAAIIVLPFSGSLIGWLGLLITVLVFSVTAVRSAFLRRREDPAAVRRVVGAAIAIVVLLSLVLATVPAIRRSRSFVKIRTRISSMDAANDWGSLTSRRVDYFWRLAVRMMADFPLTGVGIGAYIVELPNEAVLHRARWRNADSAENYGLQVGAELGIPALALAVWIFWRIFLRSARTWKASFGRDSPRYRTFMTAGCFAGLVSMLAAFFFHTYLGSYEIILLFWFLAALP
ncbi:MAG: O-antigen ligase family protein, partial [Candidatus Aminicenantes bacterium]|nr:O-antigen ligase family protein [Candidatus Aminicenantes bacterium]